MVQRQRGQAAVESVGITVAIALLVAAMSLWLAREAPPAARAPDVIGAIVGPLDPGVAQGAQSWSPATVPPFLDAAARGRGDRPIGRALRAIGRGVMTGTVLAAEGDRGFREGFRDRLRERAVGLIRDPIGGLGELPDPSLLTPAGLADRILARGGELRDYLRHLRALPPRVAARTAGRDLGEAAADLTVDLGEAALRKRLAGRLGSRVPRSPRPGDRGVPAP